MKKYWAIFKVSWSQMFAYRLNFILGRFRSIVVLVMLYYVWHSLAGEKGSFASYSELELITYVFIVNILRSVIFGTQSRELAQEINSGMFSKYLTMPLNIFWYNFFREAAQRIVNLISAIVEVFIFTLIIKADLFWQSGLMNWGLFMLSLIFALFIYYLLSFIVSMLAFWSREAMGPRFLFEWTLEFMSGIYFPLNILSTLWFSILIRLPFFYLIFFPISIYLGTYDTGFIIRAFVQQLFWLLILSALAKVIWERGLRKYSGEGI